MGAWGNEPWQTDGGADWFTSVFRGVSFKNSLHRAFQEDDNYDEIRAACFLLECLGRPGVWPDDLAELKTHLVLGIQRLTSMVKPEVGEDSTDFLELWGDDPEVKKAVKGQIKQLKARLKDLDADALGAVRGKVFGNS